MNEPLRQQFRPEDFGDPQSAASKVDRSFQEVGKQLGQLGARQVVRVDFINAAASFPVKLSQVRLDKVAGFAVLGCWDAGTSAAPLSPPTPVQVSSLAWEKVMSPGPAGAPVPGYQIRSMAGLTTGNRYTLTLEAVGG